MSQLYPRNNYLSHLLRLIPHLINRPDIQERLLGQIIRLAFGYFVEAAERVGEFHVLARQARELLGDDERLAEESLQLAGPADDQLVLFAQFVDAQNRDDVLQIA